MRPSKLRQIVCRLSLPLSLLLTPALALADGNPFKPDPGESGFAIYGDAMQYLLPLSAAGISLVRHDSEGLRQTVGGCAITIASSHLLKWAFNGTAWGRRPDGGSHSFPSGHTAAAQCGAMALQSRYGDRYGIPALALATTVGMSRVGEQRHHVRDVAASTVLAWASARQMGRDNPSLSAVGPLASIAIVAAYGATDPDNRQRTALTDETATSADPVSFGLGLLPNGRGGVVPALQFVAAF